MKRTKEGPRFTQWGKALLTGLLLTSALQFPMNGEAAAEGSPVRVAMYLDLGSTYKSTVPAVTLNAQSAWEAGLKGDSGFESLVTFAQGQSARFSVDGFKVKALESSNWATVSAAVKKLQGTSDKPVAYMHQTASGMMYEIYTGPYISRQEADKAATRVTGTLTAYLNGQTPGVRGNYYASISGSGSRTEAETLYQSLISQGVNAYLVLTAGQQYSVWVGGASDEAALAQEIAELSQLQPALSITQVQQHPGALLIHRDVTGNLETPSPVDHYELSGSNAKLLILDSEDSLIQVLERSARKYRGDFEISRMNGQLALVNEVSLEQYLYSVVAGEVPSSWHQEALKAQAVAARSYALYHSAGNRFKVAGLVDTTLSQVYNGADKEVSSIVQAVDSTAGEVLTSGGKVIEGIFSSNTGGITADSSEVWNSLNPTYRSVASQEDEVAQSSMKYWYYVLLSNGQTGYLREDNVIMTGGSTSAGLLKLTVTGSNVNVRPLPLIQADATPVGKMNPGDQAVVLNKVKESNSYSWIRGPFSSETLLKSLKGKTSTEAPSPIYNLEVTQRGPSGRVTQVTANGQVLDVRYPDSFRSALGGLPSTLFDIAATGRYTVQSALGNKYTTAPAGTTVLSASGSAEWDGGNMVIMGGQGTARVVDHNNAFMFYGRGNGHGLGMSQWGAKGMADAGYDYRQILQHYYQNVTITKE